LSLAERYSSMSACQSRWLGEKLSSTATLGRKVTRPELEAAGLDDADVGGLSGQDVFGQGRAVVAAGKDRTTGGFEQMAYEHDRGGLAVGAGDGHHGASTNQEASSSSARTWAPGQEPIYGARRPGDPGLNTTRSAPASVREHARRHDLHAPARASSRKSAGTAAGFSPQTHQAPSLDKSSTAVRPEAPPRPPRPCVRPVATHAPCPSCPTTSA
jgi:hypothetical protein